MSKLKLFLTVTKHQWLYLSLGLLLSIMTLVASVGLLSVAGFLICGSAVAGITAATAASFNYLLPATIVRFFAIVRIISRYGDRVLTHEATFRILKNLRVWFYQTLEPLTPAYLLNHRNNELLNRMISDVDALDKVYLRLLIPFFSAIFLIMLSGIFIYYFSPQLSLVICLILLFGITIVPYIAYSLGKQPGISVLKKVSKLRTQFIEYSMYLIELMLYGKTEQYDTQLLTEHDALIQEQKTQASIRGVINALINLLTSGSLFIVLLVGILLVRNHVLDGANLGLLTLMIFGVFEAINLLPQSCQYLGETQSASDRVIELASVKSSIQFPDTEIRTDNLDLLFDQVSFQYPNISRLIFNEFSLHIPFGSHLAITGSTGVGKSTLAYLVVRCYDPTIGEIYLGKYPIRNYPETQLRETICYVNQNSHVFHASIRENLLLANSTATDIELYAVLELVLLKEIVLQLPDQLATTMGEFGKQFSGGQIRRFALARAVLKSAPITILDEVLEGVDDETAITIVENLQRVFLNKTLIMITHQTLHITKQFRIIELPEVFSAN